MRIISKRKLHDYYIENPQSKIPLTEWYYNLTASTATNIMQLRKEFNSVDAVHDYTVFNIGGNNYRLVAAIHYNTQRCYVRAIWTHAQYSKPTNQAKLKQGEL